ncbi:MAG: beta-ketoacyl-ACP synthase [Acetobacteraceae bacterium]|nr:beta-ketoacyl-ACP synthase [Acetobacteraceae bacterium]
MSNRFFLPAMAVATCLGVGKVRNARGIFTGSQSAFAVREDLLPGRALTVGALPDALPSLPAAMTEWNSRNNRLLAALVNEIKHEIDRAVRRFGPDRIGIVIGTSTSGIAEGEAAIAHFRKHGSWPEGFHYTQQEIGSGATFLAHQLGLTGPAYVVATACSSSAKAFASGRRLIQCGLVDAVLVGGADTLCRLALAGFTSLEAVSPRICNPFSVNRDGITIGEAGALFLMTTEPAEIALLGAGETSDAYHLSAPDPEGTGPVEAMRAALDEAQLAPSDIAYVNLHGTATPLNDAMESKAINAMFGASVPCSSTKSITGHTLGAAGAVEAAVLWMTLSHQWNPQRLVPPHIWDGVADPALPRLNLAERGSRLPDRRGLAALSNSLAFGGSNCSLVLGQT